HGGGAGADDFRPHERSFLPLGRDALLTGPGVSGTRFGQEGVKTRNRKKAPEKARPQAGT
ncbi:MAG: hypothetical protein ABGW82_02460, partial [Paracoccus sp. (in: a-proteobacteria)]